MVFIADQLYAFSNSLLERCMLYENLVLLLNKEKAEDREESFELLFCEIWYQFQQFCLSDTLARDIDVANEVIKLVLFLMTRLACVVELVSREYPCAKVVDGHYEKLLQRGEF